MCQYIKYFEGQKKLTFMRKRCEHDKQHHDLITVCMYVIFKLCIHELPLTRSTVLTDITEQGHINTVCSSLSCRLPPCLHTREHARRQTRAYRMYFKSLMCKQLLLFAQTTCSFWTQTKLWRRMGCVNSVGCVGDAFHKRSRSTWCGLHQMVGPCRTAASSNRTHTDLKERRNILTCFAFLKSTTSSGAGKANANCCLRII